MEINMVIAMKKAPLVHATKIKNITTKRKQKDLRNRKNLN